MLSRLRLAYTRLARAFCRAMESRSAYRAYRESRLRAFDSFLATLN